MMADVLLLGRKRCPLISTQCDDTQKSVLIGFVSVTSHPSRTQEELSCCGGGECLKSVGLCSKTQQAVNDHNISNMFLLL